MARLFALLLSLAFGAGFSQVPEYAQQYRQRLGGAIDELSAIVERFDRDAREAGLERAQALARYRAAADDFLAERGRDMARSIDRLDRLRGQQSDLAGAGDFLRLIPLVSGLDETIARRALGDFEPALPLTLEGLGLGAIGLVVGRLAAALAGLLTRPLRRRPEAAVAGEAGDGTAAG